MQTIAELLAQELGASPVYVQNVIDLLDQGNTIPFIARYRKELHGSMDDTALRKLEDRLTYLRNLEQRRQEVKSAIEGQEQADAGAGGGHRQRAATLAEVEDLYRPYKQKRRTRATVAREKGLAPLAELLLAQRRDCPDPMQAAQDFIDPERRAWRRQPTPCRGPTTSWRSCCRTMRAIRKTLRELLRRQGRLRSLATGEEDSVYRLYYDFEQSLPKLAGPSDLGHQPRRKGGLPLRHGAAGPGDRTHRPAPGGGASPALRPWSLSRAPAEDAYDRLIYPSSGAGGAQRLLTERAGEGAIQQLCPEPEAPADAAAGEGPGDHGAGSRLSPTAARWRWWTAPVRCWIQRWYIPPTAQRQKQEAIATLWPS